MEIMHELQSEPVAGGAPPPDSGELTELTAQMGDVRIGGRPVSALLPAPPLMSSHRSEPALSGLLQPTPGDRPSAPHRALSTSPLQTEPRHGLYYRTAPDPDRQTSGNQTSGNQNQTSGTQYPPSSSPSQPALSQHQPAYQPVYQSVYQPVYQPALQYQRSPQAASPQPVTNQHQAYISPRQSVSNQYQPPESHHQSGPSQGQASSSQYRPAPSYLQSSISPQPTAVYYSSVSQYVPSVSQYQQSASQYQPSVRGWPAAGAAPHRSPSPSDRVVLPTVLQEQPAVGAGLTRLPARPDPERLRLQHEACGRLRTEVLRTRRLLDQLRTDTARLESAPPPPPPVDERLRWNEENQRLRRQCEAVMAEIEGLRAAALGHRSGSAASSSGVFSLQRLDNSSGADMEEGPQWECGSCTFLNHPAMSSCEQCEMPRLPGGTSSSCSVLAPPVPLRPPPAAGVPHSACYCHPHGAHHNTSPSGGGARADRGCCSWPESDGGGGGGGGGSSGGNGRSAHQTRLGTL